MQIVLPENASHIIICTNENEAAEAINKGIGKKGRRVANCIDCKNNMYAVLYMI